MHVDCIACTSWAPLATLMTHANCHMIVRARREHMHACMSMHVRRSLQACSGAPTCMHAATLAEVRECAHVRVHISMHASAMLILQSGFMIMGCG